VLWRLRSDIDVVTSHDFGVIRVAGRIPGRSSRSLGCSTAAARFGW